MNFETISFEFNTGSEVFIDTSPLGPTVQPSVGATAENDRIRQEVIDSYPPSATQYLASLRESLSLFGASAFSYTPMAPPDMTVGQLEVMAEDFRLLGYQTEVASINDEAGERVIRGIKIESEGR